MSSRKNKPKHSGSTIDTFFQRPGSTTVETHTTQNEQTDQDKQVNPSADESNAVQNSNEKSMPHDESESVSIDKPDEATGSGANTADIAAHSVADNATENALSFEEQSRRHLEYFSVTTNGKKDRNVRCKTCVAHPTTVNLFSKNNKPAPITTTEGTGYRKETVTNHLASVSHIECTKAQLLLSVTSGQRQGAMDFHITQANELMANRIGKLSNFCSKHLELLQKSLDSLKGEPLLGGWEGALENEIVVNEDEKHYLKEVELQ
ncbi:uncharacterized protein LOC129572043 [Sitodiplosis mosellana]|uniref:uncharacterized protein LOC129572043 n=1 Tax=Sitodiplosis mosellana TaxID=263140 RepID=UPI002444C85C|nr:uncharacterized protein LOC129572043 [Sitodiplosis mosellana]